MKPLTYIAAATMALSVLASSVALVFASPVSLYDCGHWGNPEDCAIHHCSWDEKAKECIGR